MSISFFVPGTPATAGSKRAVPIRKGDGTVVGLRAIHDNPHTKPWMAAVASAAREAYQGELLRGPLRLELTFFRPRPKGHFGSGKNGGRIKESAPTYPTTKPDVLKLGRAIEDALKGVIYADDSQNVEVIVRKVWGESAGCRVEISELVPGDVKRGEHLTA